MLEVFLKQSKTLRDVMLNPIHLHYMLEKKKGNLKDIYTARINSKLRLYIKPVGKYPYILKDIVEVCFLCIDDKHYGEG